MFGRGGTVRAWKGQAWTKSFRRGGRTPEADLMAAKAVAAQKPGFSLSRQFPHRLDPHPPQSDLAAMRNGQMINGPGWVSGHAGPGARDTSGGHPSGRFRREAPNLAEQGQQGLTGNLKG